jgi:DNA-binding PadR family transcriptional regulator
VKYYRLTEEGRKALAEVKKVHDIMWQAFSVAVSEES